jgi:hypothetical protein
MAELDIYRHESFFPTSALLRKKQASTKLAQNTAILRPVTSGVALSYQCA